MLVVKTTPVNANFGYFTPPTYMMLLSDFKLLVCICTSLSIVYMWKSLIRAYTFWINISYCDILISFACLPLFLCKLVKSQPQALSVIVLHHKVSILCAAFYKKSVGQSYSARKLIVPVGHSKFEIDHNLQCPFAR